MIIGIKVKPTGNILDTTLILVVSEPSIEAAGERVIPLF